MKYLLIIYEIWLHRNKWKSKMQKYMQKNEIAIPKNLLYLSYQKCLLYEVKTEAYIVWVQIGETNTQNIVFSYANYFSSILNGPDLIILAMGIWTTNSKKSACASDVINALLLYVSLKPWTWCN